MFVILLFFPFTVLQIFLSDGIAFVFLSFERHNNEAVDAKTAAAFDGYGSPAPAPASAAVAASRPSTLSTLPLPGAPSTPNGPSLNVTASTPVGMSPDEGLPAVDTVMDDLNTGATPSSLRALSGALAHYDNAEWLTVRPPVPAGA